MPQRVLHILNGASGGAARSSLSVVELLRERGIRSHAVCHDMGSREDRELLRDRFEGRISFVPLYWWNKKIRAQTWKRPVIELMQALKTGSAAWSTARVIALARRWGVDLIHSNTILTPEGGLAAAALGLPHVWHLRELVGDGQPYRFPVEGRRMGRIVDGLSSVVIANSEASAALIRPWLSRPPLVIPNAIDVDAFAPHADRRERPLRVVMLGNLTCRWKEHRLLLDAVAAAKAPLTVELYGEAPPPGEDDYVDGLRRHIEELGLTDRVELKGHTDDVPGVLSRADVMLHPTSSESFGRVAVEGMAAGLPVVGVAAGGIGEVVVDGVTGLLAAPKDPQGLAERLDRLAGDPALRRRLGAGGRAHAERHYSLQSLGRSLAEAYRLASRRPVLPMRRPSLWSRSAEART